VKAKYRLKITAILITLALSACASHPPKPPKLTSNVRIPINHCLLPNAIEPCEISTEIKG
jgi:hypothetical protein